MQQIEAVIFDMDGVLIDSEPIYMQHVLDFYRQYEISIPHQEVAKLAGSSNEAGWEMMASWWKSEITPQEMERLYEANSKEEDIVYSEIINPYVRYILPRLKKEGIRLAIASSSSMKAITTMLKECNLSMYFDKVVTGHDFTFSKPDPAIYLHTIEELNVSKKRCIIIEDSTYGIQAGKAAGIKVIAKHDERYGFDQSQADYLVNDLLEAYHLILQGDE